MKCRQSTFSFQQNCKHLPARPPGCSHWKRKCSLLEPEEDSVLSLLLNTNLVLVVFSWHERNEILYFLHSRTEMKVDSFHCEFVEKTGISGRRDVPAQEGGPNLSECRPAEQACQGERLAFTEHVHRPAGCSPWLI